MFVTPYYPENKKYQLMPMKNGDISDWLRAINEHKDAKHCGIAWLFDPRKKPNPGIVLLLQRVRKNGTASA